MLETDSSLLPWSHASLGGAAPPPSVVSVGFENIQLDELDRLLTTLGVVPAGRILVSQRKIHPATYIGAGKIEEVKNAVVALNAQAVILDVELSPNQLRNLEKSLGLAVLDRPGVIIEIFTQHARTKEAKTQVGLARLQYLLPRLTHFWSHFERQRGGGTANRGMGEKQIEVDRRLVKQRMALLRDRLKDIEKERQLQRAGRKDVLKVAIVGYTNAGKSTLLNQLTHSRVLAEDKLFATLDASIRTLDPHSHPPIVIIDTVGFISRLPHTLVASFRSTLEEVMEADLLVHIVDASSVSAREEFETTEAVLKELGAENKEKLVVLNKMDLLDGDPAAKIRAKVVVPGAQMVSALNPEDVKRLRTVIQDHFRSNMEVWEIVIPYSESRLEARIRAHGSVEVCRHIEKGTFYRVRMEGAWAKKLELEKYRL